MKKCQKKSNNISFKIEAKHSRTIIIIINNIINLSIVIINNIDNNNLDDDKISDIRRILNRLIYILPKSYRKKIKKRFYETENNEDSEAEKEKNDEYLRKLVRSLNNKEKYSPYDRDDFDYYGIRDIEIYLMRLVKKTVINQY